MRSLRYFEKEMGNKKILIITYYWPPSGGVGVQRWLHFTKNLKKEGWDPIIYTPENPQFDITDDSLQKFTEGIEVIKSSIWEPFGLFHQLTGNKNKNEVKQGLVLEKPKKTWKDDLIVWIRGNLFIPDPRMFWVKPSVKFLSGIIKERKIETVITTGPPHSMHLIGLGLKKEFPEIKWVADFRDPWSEWDVLPKLMATKRTLKQHRSLELKVLKKSDHILTVSNSLLESLKSKFPEGQVSLVTNGISDDKTKIYEAQTERTSGKFVVGYYGMLNEIRDPETLWGVLEEICEQNEVFNHNLEIRLGGIVANSILDRLNKSKWLSGKVVSLGYLNHEQVFDEYQKCDLLLLLLNKSDNAKWILPMKFFEYLSATKPILSLGPEDSDLAKMFEGFSVGEMIDFDHHSAISQFVLSIFEETYDLNLEHFQRLLKLYSRSNQTKELIKVLETL